MSDNDSYDPFPSSDDSSDEARGDGTEEWFRTPANGGSGPGGGDGGGGGGGGGGRSLKDDARAYRSLLTFAPPSPNGGGEKDGGENSSSSKNGGGVFAVPGAPLISSRMGRVPQGADGKVPSVVVAHGGSGDQAYYSMGAIRVRGAEHEHAEVGRLERETRERWKASEAVMDGSLAKNVQRFVRVLVDNVEGKIGGAGSPRGKRPLTPAGRPYDEGLFDSPVRINLNLAEYVRRVVGATKIPSECLLIASMYIDRLWTKAGLTVTQNNRHGVVLSCMMMASKMYEDVPWANSYWSALSGTFPAVQLNEMELFITKGLAFNLTIKYLAFQEYAKLAEL